MMPELKGRTGHVLWHVLWLYIMLSTAGCVNEQWVKEYVRQELGPLRTDSYKPLEDDLAGVKEELKSLRKEVEEMGAGLKTHESLELALKENKEELLWLRENADVMETRLSALEHTVEIPGQGPAVTETVPEAAQEPSPEPESAQEEARPLDIDVPESQPLEGLTALAEELKKLHKKTSDVSWRIEHIDTQYQQYHKEVGELRVDIMNDIDTLNKGMLALDVKMSALMNTQKVLFEQIAEQSQWDVESLEQKLRGLIKGLPE
ncbi:MAG: hypothetical protein V3V54_03700 [Candidatus Brocadiales bacterium]